MNSGNGTFLSGYLRKMMKHGGSFKKKSVFDYGNRYIWKGRPGTKASGMGMCKVIKL